MWLKLYGCCSDLPTLQSCATAAVMSCEGKRQADRLVGGLHTQAEQTSDVTAVVTRLSKDSTGSHGFMCHVILLQDEILANRQLIKYVEAGPPLKLIVAHIAKKFLALFITALSLTLP
jgi:hypothetical protein